MTPVAVIWHVFLRY